MRGTVCDAHEHLFDEMKPSYCFLCGLSANMCYEQLRFAQRGGETHVGISALDRPALVGTLAVERRRNAARGQQPVSPLADNDDASAKVAKPALDMVPPGRSGTMKAFIGELGLLGAAKQLATDVEPWATEVLCAVNDYVAAGCFGDRFKLPIPKDQTGPYWNTTHPLSPERMYEMAARERAQTHVVILQPSQDVPPGEVWIARG